MRSLEDNKVGAEGAKALASALEVNKVLTSLNLAGSYFDGAKIGDEGAAALAAALKVNAVLTELK